MVQHFFYWDKCDNGLICNAINFQPWKHTNLNISQGIISNFAAFWNLFFLLKRNEMKNPGKQNKYRTLYHDIRKLGFFNNICVLDRETIQKGCKHFHLACITINTLAQNWTSQNTYFGTNYFNIQNKFFLLISFVCGGRGGGI